MPNLIVQMYQRIKLWREKGDVPFVTFVLVFNIQFSILCYKTFKLLLNIEWNKLLVQSFFVRRKYISQIWYSTFTYPCTLTSLSCWTTTFPWITEDDLWWSDARKGKTDILSRIQLNQQGCLINPRKNVETYDNMLYLQIP